MIKKYGGQFVERESYDRKYGLKSIRWPQQFGKDKITVLYLEDVYSDEKPSIEPKMG